MSLSDPGKSTRTYRVVLSAQSKPVRPPTQAEFRDLAAVYRSLKVIHRTSNIRPVFEDGMLRFVDAKTRVTIGIVELAATD